MGNNTKAELQALQQKIEQRISTCYAFAARAFMAHQTGSKQYLQLFSDWLSTDYRELVTEIEELDVLLRRHDKELFPALESMKRDYKVLVEQSDELGKMAILLMDKR